MENWSIENWILAFAILVAFWFLMSWKLIQENERGVIVLLGRVGKMLKPGLCFCPWLISTVKMYTMTPMTFTIKVPTAITKNGKVLGYKEDGKEIEKVEVDVFLVLTTYFSDDETRLCETARRAPGSNAKSLGPIIAPYIKDVTRSIFAEMPWVLSYQEREKVLAYITSKIIPNHPYFRLITSQTVAGVGGKKYNLFSFETVASGTGESEALMSRYNPLVQFKLDMSRTSLSITDINFCDPVLAASLTLAESSRLKADADATTSERETQRIKDEGLAAAEIERVRGINITEAARKTGFDKADFTRQEQIDKAEWTRLQGDANAEVIKKEGLARAKAREEMISVIKANSDLESLRTLVEMAQGTSNTILYGLPGGMSDKLSKILGGNKPEDLLGLLKDPEILKVLKEAFEKITK